MKEHVHCIGIGGIGVSALARLYRARGWRVSGSDLKRSEITDALKKEGIRVFIGPQRRSNLIREATQVVYSVAVKPDNPELREARQRGLPAKTYAQAVGDLTKRYQTIAVAGSHGKSTTTAMVALMLTRAGLDPTVIVGAKLREFGNTNFRLGKSEYLVLEADEYRGSFWNYHPWIAVITNIDREHLDFYRDLSGITKGFEKFISGIRHDGHLVLNADDERLARLVGKTNPVRPGRIHRFSLRDREAEPLRSILNIPGVHNVANALAAYRAGQILEIPKEKILATLLRYRGIWRRFDYQGKFAGAKVFADYAHHPTEIKATLQATREKFPRSRIWCVFQPHHYERTRDLFREFSNAFARADAAIILDIYEVAGREQKRRSGDVSAKTLAAAINRRGVPALYLEDPEHRLKPFLMRWLEAGDVLLMAGAGSIWEMTKALMKGMTKP